MLGHSGEKRFACAICSTEFSDAGTLRHHIRSHTGDVKPYTCAVCGKGLASTTSLKLHMMKHTGEKPHTCHICDKGFITTSHLKYHMTTHMGPDLKLTTRASGQTHSFGGTPFSLGNLCMSMAGNPAITATQSISNPLLTRSPAPISLQVNNTQVQHAPPQVSSPSASSSPRMQPSSPHSLIGSAPGNHPSPAMSTPQGSPLLSQSSDRSHMSPLPDNNPHHQLSNPTHRSQTNHLSLGADKSYSHNNSPGLPSGEQTFAAGTSSAIPLRDPAYSTRPMGLRSPPYSPIPHHSEPPSLSTGHPNTPRPILDKHILHQL